MAKKKSGPLFPEAQLATLRTHQTELVKTERELRAALKAYAKAAQGFNKFAEKVADKLGDTIAEMKGKPPPALVLARRAWVIAEVETMAGVLDELSVRDALALPTHLSDITDEEL